MPRKVKAPPHTKRRVIIEARNISAIIGGLRILDQVSFSVRRGEYLGIIGPNGGGKTTLLNMLLKLNKPTSGSVHLFGTPVNEFREWGRIGYVPQRVALQAGSAFPATVREVVATGRLPRLGLFKRYKPEDRKAIDDALEVVDIARFQDRVVGDLSGGERQRVFIARALAGDPDILILDEPTVGVDSPSQEAFFTFIRNLNKDRGMTVLFVTHDVNVVVSEATTVLCLNHKMICHGTTDEFVKQKYMHKLYEEMEGHHGHHQEHEG